MNTRIPHIIFFLLCCQLLMAQADVNALYDRYEKISLNSISPIDSFLTIHQAAERKKLWPLYNEASEDILIIYQEQNSLKRKYQFLNDVLDKSRSYKNQEGFAFAANQLSSIYKEGQLYSKSRYYLKLIEKEIDTSHYDQYQLFGNIAELYGAEGKADSAAYYLKKDNIEKSYKDVNGQISRLQKLADIYILNERYTDAIDVFRQLEKLIIDSNRSEELFIVANNLGYVHSLADNHDQAITYLKRAEKNMQSASLEMQLEVLVNIAIAFNKNEDFINSELYLLNALELSNKNNVNNSIVKHLLSEVRLETGQIFKAEYYNELAITAAESENNMQMLSDAYYNAALIQAELFDHERALQFYEKHVQVRNQLDKKKNKVLDEALKAQETLTSTENELKFFKMEEINREAERKRLEVIAENLKLANDTLLLSQQQIESQLLIVKGEKEVREERLKVQNLEAVKVKNENALLKQSLNVARQQRSLDSIETKKKFELDSLQREQELIEQEAQKLEQEAITMQRENEINRLELDAQKDFKKFVSIIAGLAAIIFLGTLLSFFNLRGRNKIIKEEREKSDLLLHSILPEETAKELKLNGFASPRNYESVSVLFTDFTNFTNISSTMSAEELILELEACFSAFDAIIDRYNLERIKTIGDSYMCAGGVPVENEHHAENALEAAVEMQNFLKARFKDKRSRGIEYWKMRIGIHTGPVVAGVIGKNKFAYDIWGDTVNVASRLENVCPTGEILISDNTRKLIKKPIETKDSETHELKGDVTIQTHQIKF